MDSARSGLSICEGVQVKSPTVIDQVMRVAVSSVNTDETANGPLKVKEAEMNWEVV